MDYIPIIIAGIIVLYILSKTKKSAPKTNFFFSFDITEDKLELNEKINLWVDPKTNEIRFYTQGHDHGKVLVGKLTNNTVLNHLNNNGKYKAFVSEKMPFVNGITVELI